jgi:hypothetical protein
MNRTIFLAALLFYILSNQITYNFTNSVFGHIANSGCPTQFGVMVHTIVFAGVLAYLL